MNTTIRIESISKLHALLGMAPPPHPLISLIENTPTNPMTPNIPVMNVQVTTDLYSVSLKQSGECGLKYGRQVYDFQEGSLMFLSPGQTITPVTQTSDLDPEEDSWILLFHPELIRPFPLASNMAGYTFFQYRSHEALHVSDKEKQHLALIVRQIKEEYSLNLDSHSPELIVSNLELLFNYCKRYYSRQFVTRTGVNRDVVARLETFLLEYFQSGRAQHEGVPTVQLCAEEMGYSPNYLSDLLRKETGRNTREHIYQAMVHRAQDLLRGSDDSVSQIAYSLGFEYPQHFSKLFKNITGTTPAAYRN